MRTRSFDCSAATRSARHAARDGDIAALRDSIAKGADIGHVWPWTQSRDLLDTVAKTAMTNGHDACLRAVLDAGLNLSEPEANPLVHAARIGHAGYMRTLMDAGADPNVGSGKGTTPLHAAANAGNAEAIRLLLVAGADPHRRDQDGRTPMHAAASSAATTGDCSCLVALMDAGADPFAVTDSPHSCPITPFQCAMTHDCKTDALRLLFDVGKRSGALTDQILGDVIETAVSRGDPDTTRMLLGAHSERPIANHLIINRVVDGGNPECLRLVLTHGVERETTDMGPAGTTLIGPPAPTVAAHAAVERKRHEMLRVALDFGADLRDAGDDLVRMAVGKGDADCYRLLVAAGLDPLARTSKYPVESKAFKGGNPHVIRMVLDAGGDPLVPDEYGNPAYQSLQINVASDSDIALMSGCIRDIVVAGGDPWFDHADETGGVKDGIDMILAGGPSDRLVLLVQQAAVADWNGTDDRNDHLPNLLIRCRNSTSPGWRDATPESIAVLHDAAVLAASEHMGEQNGMAYFAAVTEQVRAHQDLLASRSTRCDDPAHLAIAARLMRRPRLDFHSHA